MVFLENKQFIGLNYILWDKRGNCCMNILILGNGFDLAHGLPTKYTDFLEFVKRVKILMPLKTKKIRYSKFSKEYLDDWSINREVKEYFAKIIKERLDVNIENELFQLVKDNFWLDYFIQCKNYIEEGWIDFEKEISNKIQDIDCLWKNRLEDITKINGEQLDIHKYTEFLKGVSRLGESDICSERDIEFIRDKLLFDLKRMVRCLEIYLSDCVSKIPFKSVLEDVEQIKFDKILSFNYTDTYKNLYASYDDDLEYDFIHGKADIFNSIDSNNMVLGIDEYLVGENISKDINFIEFKKYYQRIHKETGCKYKNWIEQIQKEEHITHNIYIFGHSLDITDGDVLRELVLRDNVNTIIFYYDKNAYGSQIKNLVQVISRDELIQRVYGEKKSIIFRKQKKPIQILPKNRELQKDIVSLKNIHLLSNREIRDLVHKIQSRIRSNDTFYISNLDDLIVLYSEMLCCKLFDAIEQKYFVDIARILISSNQQCREVSNYKSICKYYDDRVEILYENILNLYKNTSKKYTKEEFQRILSSKNIKELIKFCEHYRIDNKEELEEVLEIMLNKFNSSSNSPQKVYEQILKLLDASETGIVIELLENQINNASDNIKKARLQFLYKECRSKV